MIARFFIMRPVASALLALAMMLTGLLAWRMLPTAPLPEVDFPAIAVEASLPGANPRTMAAAVAVPLQRALGSIAGIRILEATSGQGTVEIVMIFELGRDINDAARDVQAAINAARGQLPSGMPSEPVYRKLNPSQAPIMALALSSDSLPPERLYDEASAILAQKLSQVPGVGEVSIGGASLPAVRVQLNPHALAAQGIALDEVREAIARSNALTPLGMTEQGDRSWTIGSNAQLRAVSDYEMLVVARRPNGLVRLADVATVTEATENRYAMGFHNDRPAVLLTVRRQPGANIVATTDAIQASLPGLRALLPAQTKLEVVLDRSPGIRATIREAQLALALSVGLVILVVGLFLRRWHAAVIPSLAIPVALVTSFAAMWALGFSLNNLSLTALIVAAGLVVDDAIVVLENISRHIEAGLSPRRAALRGTREVGFTLIAMNLSLLVVFIAILFMGGVITLLFREFSLTLAAAMLISLIVSLTLTPALCARLLKPTPAKTRRAGWPARIAAFYERTLDIALRHRRMTLALLAGVMAINVGLYIVIPKGFLPEQDTGQLTAFARGDDGMSFQLMQPKIETYRHYLLADPAVADVVGQAGGETGINNASMMIRLKPMSERRETAGAVVERLRAGMPKVPGGVLWVNVDQDIQLEPPGQQGQDFHLRLLSPKLEGLKDWQRKAAAALEALPELTDVDGRADGGNLQINLDIDRDAAARLGVDMRTITGVLNNSFSQRQVATLYGDLNQYRVILELEPRYTTDPGVLDLVHVIAADGRRVPLTAFTTRTQGLADDWIPHRDQFAARRVSFSLAPGVAPEQAAAAIDRAVAGLMLPNDVQAKMAGELDIAGASAQSQPLLLLGVILAVFIVLGILYESLLHPLTILSTLPSAGVGAFLALWLTGFEFSLIALLGLFLLIGMVMKNAILMIDFALARQRRDGLDPLEAIREAARLRLRPILMTNMAAMLGALPLVLGMGEGAEMRQPLGICIVGGLLVSQLLTLYTTPVVYLVVEHLGAKFRNRAGRVPAQETPIAPR
ncbi:efflux RND transporter permease subunit [Sphingomonas sp. C3-2]|uniref:efflux RND transporter permease subunit n=1 Tax=Sphingomonas sp. C3-2 TaxID=3062169 RepID=UPI00294AA89E|nr:efflux RND transporter permease subunit [Sphingomonas sp. C3-2]WOK36801.1 efflux RND transporter permease subunit [Sphingomonas sp. C3-2]